MRVGLVLDHYDPRRGGVEQWTSQYIDWLLAQGDSVEVVAAGFAAGLTQSIVQHIVPSQHSRPGWGAAVEQRLKQLDLDVIHDMGAGWYCDVLQPHGGCRKAWFEQSLKMLPRWQRPVKRLAARWLPRYREFAELSRRQAAGDHVVLALSQMTYRHLNTLDAVPVERLQLVYNGVDVGRFSPTNRELHRDPVRDQYDLGNKVVFLIVAHNLKLKGLPVLLQALAELNKDASDIHLLVVGNRRTSAFRRQAEKLGISDKVTFVGSVDDTVPLYAAADVYVQPSCYDCCSLVVLEALASGLPVITTACNGAGELLEEGRHGYVVDDPFDSAVLADRMRRLVDPAVRIPMESAARGLATQHSFERNAREIRALYDDVCRSQLPGRKAA